jgi:hypothetical protein
LSDDTSLDQASVAQSSQLGSHAVVVTPEALRELLRGRRSAERRQRLEQLPSQRKREQVFIDLAGRVHRHGPG